MSNSSSSADSHSNADVPRKKLPRPSDLLFKSYECAVCLEFLVPPIVRCPGDHSFCKSCVEKSALGSNGLRCCLCRRIIDLDDINTNLEEQMSKIITSCRFNGCKMRVRLSERNAHHSVCSYSDELTKCYYALKGLSQFGNCKFVGTPTEIFKHLEEFHSLDLVKRIDVVRYMWDFPNEFKSRFRPRIFEIDYPGKGSSKSKFIMEHYYNAELKFLLFIVRSIDTDTRLQYIFSLYDKNDANYFTSYKRSTMTFKDPKIVDFPNCNTKNIICIPYHYLKEVEHICKDDLGNYFSFSIAFNVSLED